MRRGGKGEERRGRGRRRKKRKIGRRLLIFVVISVLWGLLPCSSIRHLYPNYQPYTYVNNNNNKTVLRK